MCLGGPSGGGGITPTSLPPIQMISPTPLPDAPAPPPLPPENLAPRPDDPEVVKARNAAKQRARAFQGYASTIKTGGQGVTGPALTTATKQVMG